MNILNNPHICNYFIKIKSGTSSAVKSNKRPRGTNAKGKIRGDCDDDNDNHDVTSNDKINDEYVGKVSDNDDDDADDKEDSADKDFIAVRKEPIPKKRRVSTALKAADAEWKGTVDTCVKEIESILLAMDNASGGDGSTAMDTSTSSVSKNANAVTAADGQLTYSSLRKFTRAMKFISESGKFDELMEKLDDTDGASENDDEEGEPEKECVGKMRNMLRICFDIVRGSEFYSLGNDFSLTPQSLKRSHQPNPMLVCDDAAGGGDDDEEERGEAGSELTEDNLKTALDRIIHSLEASFGFFLIISGIISWSMKLSGKLSNNVRFLPKKS